MNHENYQNNMFGEVFKTGCPNVTRRRKDLCLLAVKLLDPGTTNIFKDPKWLKYIFIDRLRATAYQSIINCLCHRGKMVNIFIFMYG